MKSQLSYRMNSIRFKIIASVLLIVTPIIILSIFTIYSSRAILIDRVKTAHTTILQTDVQKLDAELTSAKRCMNSLTFNNPTALSLTTDPDSADFYYAANRLHTDIANEFLYYNYINGFFLYIPKTDFYYSYTNDEIILNNKMGFKDFVFDKVVNDSNTYTLWQTYNYHDTAYLIQLFNHNGIIAGSFLNIASLSEQTLSNNNIAYTDYDSLCNIESHLSRNILLISQQSEQSNLCTYEVIDTNELFSTLPFIQKYIILISVILLLAIPILLIALNHIIIYPLKALTDAMMEIQKGNLEYQIEEFHTSNEYMQVNQTFNRMVQQIRELKITIYEEKLSHQKSRLNNLQLQLRPHFIINSLNMVYNFISNKDYDHSLKLIQFSVSYFRYMIKVKEDYVPLNEELNHIKNYLNIQMLRYPNHLSYDFRIDPFIETTSIPPMLVQNFVENSIKYGMNPENESVILLDIHYMEENYQPYLKIIIHDNGNGYPEELLSSLNTNEMNRLKDKIGIRNSIERIHMLYGSLGRTRFYNDHGAVSELLLPIITDSLK